MKNLKIATAQFEVRSGDKSYKLDVIERLSAEASSRGAEIVAFHECSIKTFRSVWEDHFEQSRFQANGSMEG